MTATAKRRGLAFSEIMSFVIDNFTTNKIRFLLTAFGMAVSTGSLVLVVTIGLTGKQYVLNLIQSVGANMIYVEYAGPGRSGEPPDPLTVADMHAVQQQVFGIWAASPMMELRETISLGSGKERNIMILGVAPQYREVRNLDILAGRMFDEDDTQARYKAALVEQQLADQLYGDQSAAVGRTIRIGGLPFVIVGTFKERVETFGMSEVSSNTVLIPYSVAQYFTNSDNVKQLFFSANSASEVPEVSGQIQRLIVSRHRPESVYRTENLTALLRVAAKSANALTVVLLLVSAVTLMVSGVGIMNIMLATVSARIREIGIRKAIGATSREIRWQFVAEAVSISTAGGIVGIVLGLAPTLAARWFTDYRIPISGLSVVVAIVVSSLVGILFGTVPAARAAHLDPVESLRYE